MIKQPISEIDKQRLNYLLRHKDAVSQNCQLLGERLIELGDFEIGRNLIVNGFKHDLSKFFGLEFEYLNGIPGKKKTEFTAAIKQHNHSNKHHMEHWGSPENMPDEYLAEMSCDVAARAAEFGTDVRDWVENEATAKYSFSKNSEVCKKIMGFLDLLLSKPFEKIEK